MNKDTRPTVKEIIKTFSEQEKKWFMDQDEKNQVNFIKIKVENFNRNKNYE